MQREDKGVAGARGLRGVCSRDSCIIFFNKTNISARDKVPSFHSTSKLCGVRCDIPPRIVLDRSCFVSRPRRFCEFCESGLLGPSMGPGVTRLGLTRVRRGNGLGTMVARGVSKLRRGTKDGGVCGLRNDICCGRYVGYNGTCTFASILSYGNIPRYAYKNVVGPSMILCRRPLGRDAIGNTMERVVGTSVLVITNASLAICPTTKLVECFHNEGSMLVGHSTGMKSSRFSLIVRNGMNRILNDLIM